jgi:hypothetical protein
MFDLGSIVFELLSALCTMCASSELFLLFSVVDLVVYSVMYSIQYSFSVKVLPP